MKTFKIVFGVVGLIWIILAAFVLPSTGEAGIFPSIITMVLTAPVGILFGYIFAKLDIGLSGELSVFVFTVCAVGLAYVQWVLIFKAFNKFRKK